MTEPPAPAPADEAVAEPVAEPAAVPASVEPAYPLPTARSIVSRGLELAVRETEGLRRASLYMGLVFLGLAGPALAYTVYLASSRPEIVDLFLSAADPVALAEASAYGGILGLLYMIALVGVVILGVEGQAIAASLLAAKHVGRPMMLREAVVRSRQSFWRIVGTSIAVGVLSTVVRTLVETVGAGASPAAAETAAVVGLVAAAVCTAPFGYAVTGIVLGDVGAGETLRRSVRLARARPRLAIVIALFATFASILQFFAIGAAGDILFRVVDLFGLGFDEGGAIALASLGLTLATVVAFGSLVFTMGAIVLAPQVVAFVGLTHHHAGLDLARKAAAQTPFPVPAEAAAGTTPWDSPPPVRPGRFRWVTTPTTVLMILAVFLALGGVLTLS